MANKIKKLTNDDKNNLLSKTFYVLPDNPSSKNFSPSQIRRKGYEGYVVLFDFINSLIDAINDNFDINDTAFNEHVNWISEVIDVILVRINDLGTSNVENGSGTNAVQMKQDGTSGTFDFTGKNPHATEIDETLTGEIPYGATGDFATSVGGKSSAQGKRSMSQGTTTIAKGNYSHAEGDNSVAYGNDSHAEGYATTAYGVASHSEGNNTIANGEISHAEGFDTQAIGEGAHAEGAHTVARGDYSHASGLNTEANYNGQTVIGHCNDNKETTVFEVGCGWTDENGNVVQRANGFEVHLDGHAEVKTFGTTPNSVVRRTELVEGLTDIHEKLEGKKTTYILSCYWDVEYLKTWISRGLNVEDASGNDISQKITNGEYDIGININNIKFYSNETNVNIDMYMPSSCVIVLKPIKNNHSAEYPAAETYILDRASKIFEQGDTVLITQTDVPDRWNAGMSGAFYALETRKVEVPTKASQITMDSGGTVEEAVMGLATNMFNSLWVATQSNPVSTTITSARGKSWECQYRILRNVLTDKLKVEYTLYSLTEETATAELISFSLLTTVTIGATYVTDTIAYANLPKPIEGDTYWTFDTFTFDEASDVGNQCTLLPFRGSGGFETRIFVIDSDPPASITFKKVIANVTLYQK